MQPKFRASQFRRVIRACKKLTANAVKNNEGVVLIEYGFINNQLCPPTDQRLLALLEGYDKKVTVRKMADDAARLILDACEKSKFGTNHLRICGVNLQACVADTVSTLSVLLPDSRIEVVKPACGNWTGKNHWNRFPKAENIILTEK